MLNGNGDLIFAATEVGARRRPDVGSIMMPSFLAKLALVSLALALGQGRPPPPHAHTHARTQVVIEARKLNNLYSNITDPRIYEYSPEQVDVSARRHAPPLRTAPTSPAPAWC